MWVGEGGLSVTRSTISPFRTLKCVAFQVSNQNIVQGSRIVKSGCFEQTVEKLFESPSLLPSSLSQYTHGTTESLHVWKLSRTVHSHPLKVTFKKWIEEQTGLILPIAVCVSPAVLLPPASLADNSDHYNMDLIKSDQSDQVWSGVIRIIH